MFSLKKGRAQGSLSVEFSDSWDSVFESLNERIQFPLKSKERGVQRFPTSFSLQGEFAEDSEPECIFIPAVRSLLAHIKRDMPSSVENLSFDPFLLSFWSLFDSCRRMSEADVVGSVPKIVSEIIEGILSGRYINEEDEDWISMKHGKVKLQNASSGQQESLPMFSVLSALPFFDFRGDRQHYFVEEPEAHLFPLAQAAVIKLMAFLYQTANVDFTLTTHSPYIVTALNNHILADTLLREGQKGVSAKVDAIVGKETNVRFEDVRAYTVEGGKIRSVVNQDERLIDGSAVDEASEKIQDDFLSLLDLEG